MSRPNAAIARIVTTPPVETSTYEALGKLQEEMAKFLPAKEATVDSILSALLASGHILLEDVPGVGKTTVIKALARILGLDMKRVQCTSDLLPSDIIGVEVFNANTQEFTFHRGPLFSHILLADELNRASPRTQSALLEAMGEGSVTVDRRTYPLPSPFLVFAAQNPSDSIGTYPLPESQLDRFAIKLKLNYPADEKEREIFQRSDLDPLSGLAEGLISHAQILSLQKAVNDVFVSDRVADYAKRVVDATRKHEGIRLGVSTRGGVLWIRLARARALLQRRDYVTPDDLLALSPLALGHRIMAQTGVDGGQVIRDLIKNIDVD
jgi:MoxR-like ATPase